MTRLAEAVALGAAAILLLACARQPPPPSSNEAAPGLHVAPGAGSGSGGGADGSAQRPFGRIAEALAAARDGDTIRLAPGQYRERVRIARPVAIVGAAGAVLAPEEDDAAASSSSRGRAVVEVLAGAGPVVLDGLTLRAPSAAARSVGLDAAEGATVRAHGLRVEGPFRMAVRGRGAALDLEALETEGPAVGVACLDGCRALVRDARLANGAGAGLLVGAAARLEARDGLLSGFDQCAAANAGGELVLEDCATRACALNAVAAVGARLKLRRHLHAGFARGAAVQLVDATAVIDGGWITDPGPIGIAVRQGTTRISGTVVSGARADSDGLFGDGVFALAPQALEITAASLEHNAGAGLTVLDGRAVVRDLEAVGNGVAALLAQRGASVHVEGGSVEGLGRPGLVASEGSVIEALAVLVHDAPTEQDLASNAQVRALLLGAERKKDAGPGAPRRRGR